jgi:WD40 repeat protein
LRLTHLQVQTTPQTVPLTPRPKETQPQKSVALSGGLPTGAIARLGETRLRHAAPATCLAFSPDSRQIITGGRDETLRIWDVRTGDSVQTLSVEYTPEAIRFTHSGTRLAVAAGNGTPVRFFHPGTLKKESSFEGGSSDGFEVSADGKLIASITADNHFTVSEVETGLPMLEIPQDAPTGYRFAFLPVGKSIAFADRAGKVTLFKVAGGKPLLTFDHGGPIDGLAVRGDGKRLATGGGGSGGTLKIWNLDKPGEVKNVKPAVEIKELQSTEGEAFVSAVPSRPKERAKVQADDMIVGWTFIERLPRRQRHWLSALHLHDHGAFQHVNKPMCIVSMDRV